MAKIDKILGSISPLYGAISGQGLMGNALAGMGKTMGPMGGLMPMLANEQREKLRARRTRDEEEKEGKGGAVKKMAKGGSTASKRADGCATKGKTKGRFV